MKFRNFCKSDGSPHDRYVVVGTSGSGKSTLAGKLSVEFGVPHIELDALHFRPDWEITPIDVFRKKVSEAVSREEWIVDGNYNSKVRDLIWPEADAIIWLDLPFHVVMRRIIWRSFARAITQKTLWGGCRETLRKSFFSRDSVILWAAQTWKRRRREYGHLLRQPQCCHLDVFRVRSADFSSVEVQRADS